MRVSVVLAMVLAIPAARSQWVMQESGVKASLRGIANVGGGVAWASGSEGTVVRTVDGGKLWQRCAVPLGGEKLDFRGVQAFDAKTAIVMSSGPGEASRLYKTVDGCGTWNLIITNPDPKGFWDAIRFHDATVGELLGDPVDGTFVFANVYPDGPVIIDWKRKYLRDHLEANGRGVFAASNSSLALRPDWHPSSCLTSTMWFGTSGPGGAKIFRHEIDARPSDKKNPRCSDNISAQWIPSDVPLAGTSESAGVFSIAAKNDLVLVAVGGDYEKPAMTAGTAAFTMDGGKNWTAALQLPGGYRSAVAYDAELKAWITVGPNGTDISTDDGKNWRALKPSPADAADADKNWNALSLPFVVGSKGRIGILRDGAVGAK